MDPKAITPQQKMLGAAGANVLFVISMFFPWFGVDLPEGLGVNIDTSASGWDVLPAPFIILLTAAVAAALLAAAAYDYELPVRVPPLLAAAYLSSIPLWFTFTYLIDGGPGRKWGLFLAFLFSLVATVLSFLAWREDEA